MIRLRLWLAAVVSILILSPAHAHELDPGYLDLREIEQGSYQIYWRKPDVQGRQMAIDAALPASCSPNSAPPPVHDGVAWVSHWTAVCRVSLAGQEIEIQGLEKQNTDVLVRLQPLERPPMTIRLTPTETAFAVPEAQSALQVFWTYAVLGFEHILEGWDHLLFVFALVLLIRNGRRLVGAITAFTIAHSITLALAALGHVTIPGPPVEAIIALSVVFLAIEIIKRDGSQSRLSERAPWLVSFSFGLLHGLGFAGALQDIGLPDVDIALALLAFNLGVEAGQLAFVAVIMIVGIVAWRLANILGKISPNMLKMGNALAGYGVGGVATFWLAERLSGF